MVAVTKQRLFPLAAWLGSIVASYNIGFLLGAAGVDNCDCRGGNGGLISMSRPEHPAQGGGSDRRFKGGGGGRSASQDVRTRALDGDGAAGGGRGIRPGVRVETDYKKKGTYYSGHVTATSGQRKPPEWPLLVEREDGPQSRGEGGEVPTADNVLDQVVRRLLPAGKGDEYVTRYPGSDFRFYVYESLPADYTWQNVSRCILERYGDLPSEGVCDWGSSICTSGAAHLNVTGTKWTRTLEKMYTKRRHNRNGDVVLAKILSEYEGPMRTRDHTKADLFIVPYPSAGNCECRKEPGDRTKCHELIPEKELKRKLLPSLMHYDKSTRHKHLFLISNIWWDMHRYLNQETVLSTTVGAARKCSGARKNGRKCGKIVVPYVNTNPEAQPDVLLPTSAIVKSPEEREFAVSAILSVNNHARADFVKAFENVTNLASRPVHLSIIPKDGGRSLPSEDAVQELYRNSVFCPCLRGDAVPQKRIFDAIMAGCIPVVVEHNSDDRYDMDFPSHFEECGHSIRISYPWAKATFFGDDDMGIDWSEMVVSVKSRCGPRCFPQVLESLLLETGLKTIRAKQANLRQYASLFSYGMEHNALKYPDAVASLLVQARHFVRATGAEEEISSKHYYSYDWKSLPERAKNAAAQIGFSQESWDGDHSMPIYEKLWEELDESEQGAISLLGLESYLSTNCTRRNRKLRSKVNS